MATPSRKSDPARTENVTVNKTVHFDVAKTVLAFMVPLTIMICAIWLQSLPLAFSGLLPALYKAIR